MSKLELKKDSSKEYISSFIVSLKNFLDERLYGEEEKIKLMKDLLLDEKSELVLKCDNLNVYFNKFFNRINLEETPFASGVIKFMNEWMLSNLNISEEEFKYDKKYNEITRSINMLKANFEYKLNETAEIKNIEFNNDARNHLLDIYKSKIKILFENEELVHFKEIEDKIRRVTQTIIDEIFILFEKKNNINISDIEGIQNQILEKINNNLKSK